MGLVVDEGRWQVLEHPLTAAATVHTALESLGGVRPRIVVLRRQ